MTQTDGKTQEQTAEMQAEIVAEMADLWKNLEAIKQRVDAVPQNVPTSSMRIGLLQRYKEITKKNFDKVTTRLDELLKRYTQDQKRLNEVQSLTYDLHQQISQENGIVRDKEPLEEPSQNPDSQSIPISQMTSIGRKGDYRIEVEENDIFPSGSLIVIGETFVVQVVEH